MAQVTSPIILDSTGQQIHSDLQQIKNVLTTPSAAADITYDNTGTGMQADDVQDAITELKSNLIENLLLNGLTSATKINDTEYIQVANLNTYDSFDLEVRYGNIEFCKLIHFNKHTNTYVDTYYANVNSENARNQYKLSFQITLDFVNNQVAFILTNVSSGWTSNYGNFKVGNLVGYKH